jgi:hypothetical protein
MKNSMKSTPAQLVARAKSAEAELPKAYKHVLDSFEIASRLVAKLRLQDEQIAVHLSAPPCREKLPAWQAELSKLTAGREKTESELTKALGSPSQVLSPIGEGLSLAIALAGVCRALSANWLALPEEIQREVIAAVPSVEWNT